MPVILTRPAGGSRGAISDTLGVPTDGHFEGLLDLDPDTRIPDAVDWINDILAELAPQMPDRLTSVDLSSNRTPVTGRLPSGLDSRWYQDGKVAGNTIFVIPHNNLILSSPNSSDRFGNGDKGFLISGHNDGGAGLTDVARLDIEVNFDDDVVGPDVQDLSTWDNQGSGDPCTNAIVVFVNSKGNLEVTYCGWHNDFNAWQRMNARMNISSLDEGYNSFVMAHEYGSIVEISNEYKMWYDNDTNGLAFASTPTIVQNTLSSSKYLSGVRYYTIGDTFDIDYDALNVYRKCYHLTSVSVYRFDGQSANVTRNPVSVPVYTDSLAVSETISADRSNYYTLNARLSVTLYHPWKTSASTNSSSENRLYNGYGNISTTKIEYFLDENYRLPAGSYDSVPTLTGQWNSQTTLSNGQCLVYNQRVQYPNHNLTTTLPSSNPNYTGFTGNQLYLRGFHDSAPHSNVILTLSNLTVNTHVSPVGTGDVNVEVKLPTQTGWLDAGTDYNAALFTGADGDGCKVSGSGSALTLTFGTFSTANSGGIIVVRVTFRNTNRSITGMSVNW